MYKFELSFVAGTVQRAASSTTGRSTSCSASTGRRRGCRQRLQWPSSPLPLPLRLRTRPALPPPTSRSNLELHAASRTRQSNSRTEQAISRVEQHSLCLTVSHYHCRSTLPPLLILVHVHVLFERASRSRQQSALDSVSHSDSYSDSDSDDSCVWFVLTVSRDAAQYCILLCSLALILTPVCSLLSLQFAWCLCLPCCFARVDLAYRQISLVPYLPPVSHQTSHIRIVYCITLVYLIFPLFLPDSNV